MTHISSIEDLAEMVGSDTTLDEAQAVRDVLVERDLLEWTHDASGGTCTATDAEWADAVSGVLAAIAAEPLTLTAFCQQIAASLEEQP
jgi:hypothetical protein